MILVCPSLIFIYLHIHFAYCDVMNLNFRSVDIVYSGESCADAWIEKEVCSNIKLIRK